MAIVLTKEGTLASKRAGIAKENRILRIVERVEWVLGAILFVGGLFSLVRNGSYALVICGAVVLMFALSHRLKKSENDMDDWRSAAGRRGEVRVSDIMQASLPNEMYIMNDIKVIFGRTSAQIDHLVIGPSGIFVLETKNWRGRIEGDQNADTWLQYREGSKAPVKLGNPIKQNQRHVEVLSKFLEGSGIVWPDIFSIIIFTSSHTVARIKNQTEPALGPRGAADFIEQFQGANEYSRDQIRQVTHLFLSD